jgi:hypothetical protein
VAPGGGAEVTVVGEDREVVFPDELRARAGAPVSEKLAMLAREGNSKDNGIRDGNRSQRRCATLRMASIGQGS